MNNQRGKACSNGQCAALRTCWPPIVKGFRLCDATRRDARIAEGRPVCAGGWFLGNAGVFDQPVVPSAVGPPSSGTSWLGVYALRLIYQPGIVKEQFGQIKRHENANPPYPHKGSNCSADNSVHAGALVTPYPAALFYGQHFVTLTIAAFRSKTIPSSCHNEMIATTITFSVEVHLGLCAEFMLFAAAWKP